VLSPLVRDFWPLLGGTLLGSLSPLVDQAFASVLGYGAVATLSYGNRLTALVMGIGTTSVGLIALPHFSDLAARAAWAEMGTLLRRLATATFLLAVPASAVIIIFSEPLVRLLFQRGQFSVSDTLAVAPVQALYALQIPFHLAGIVGARALNALRKTRAIMGIAVVNALVNVVGDYVFMKLLGVPGIALSTSFVYVVSSTGLFLCSGLEIRRLTRSPSSRSEATA
jgi:putative peptidoglycan lipid II flippase